MKILSVAEVKNILTKLSKERELTREQAICLEHAEHVARLPANKTEELARRLTEIGKVEMKQAIKIADLLPKERDEVVAIFAKETYIPSDDEIKQMLSIVEEYC
jgi:DNA-directed RNA polymerase subunit F